MTTATICITCTFSQLKRAQFSFWFKLRLRGYTRCAIERGRRSINQMDCVTNWLEPSERCSRALESCGNLLISHLSRLMIQFPTSFLSASGVSSYFVSALLISSNHLFNFSWFLFVHIILYLFSSWLGSGCEAGAGVSGRQTENGYFGGSSTTPSNTKNVLQISDGK